MSHQIVFSPYSEVAILYGEKTFLLRREVGKEDRTFPLSIAKSAEKICSLQSKFSYATLPAPVSATHILRLMSFFFSLPPAHCCLDATSPWPLSLAQCFHWNPCAHRPTLWYKMDVGQYLLFTLSLAAL